MKHTNIIICAPTYKYGSHCNMYNWRVQNFNNLLYLDTLAQEHAYFLDSNKNLTWDYNMFDRRTGTIYNNGMKTIFKDIQEFIDGIILYETQTE